MQNSQHPPASSSWSTTTSSGCARSIESYSLGGASGLAMRRRQKRRYCCPVPCTLRGGRGPAGGRFWLAAGRAAAGRGGRREASTQLARRRQRMECRPRPQLRRAPQPGGLACSTSTPCAAAVRSSPGAGCGPASRAAGAPAAAGWAPAPPRRTHSPPAAGPGGRGGVLEKTDGAGSQRRVGWRAHMAQRPRCRLLHRAPAACAVWNQTCRWLSTAVLFRKSSRSHA